jgi:TPP-dependent pyruvate/acetoin dehydrogenase alpha subunit
MEKEFVLHLYHHMLRIRRFEEAVTELYLRGLMPGLAHSYAGEEAIAVGVCTALRPEDYITSTHRGHGHLLAKGGKMNRMMAEILGKAAGYNQGRGGTMHIVDVSLGMLGANGIVGGGVGIALGAGWSIKFLGQERVAICFYGDGASNQGVIPEAMNMAALWKLPVIFACENNLYAQFTALSRSKCSVGLSARAEAFGLPATELDGQDVFGVYNTMSTMIQRVRSGEGPEFVEFKTYRYSGHHVGDPGTAYRDINEITEWKSHRDPLTLFTEKVLATNTCTADDLEQVERQVKAEVDEAVEFAKASPYPNPSEVIRYVYPHT